MEKTELKQEIKKQEQKQNTRLHYKGRFSQMIIYLGKLLRMFAYQNDWKVLPMGAFITAIVTFVVGKNLFVTQEGTINGAFAMTCVCIWNGFFNSIQVVCRERSIVKREHRAGLHATSYIAAHMIYQLLLCVLQTAITIAIWLVVGVKLPKVGTVTPWGVVDLALTILLITYAADMMALMISSLVRTTTTAMTVMPFMLIFQLVFSGAFFQLEGFAKQITALTISRWGMESICAVGQFNNLPMVTLWNTLFNFRNIEVMGQKPILMLIQRVESENMVGEFLAWSGLNNQKEVYASDMTRVLGNWGCLLAIIAVSALVCVIAIKLIDRDKR